MFADHPSACSIITANLVYETGSTTNKQIITAPTIRFRLDTLLQSYGFFPLVESDSEHDKAVLPVGFVAGEEARMMRCREFNRDLVQLAERYMPMRTNRMVIRSSSQAGSTSPARTIVGS